MYELFYFRRTAGRRKKPDKIQDEQPQEPGKTKQEDRPPENIGGLENSDIFDKNDLAGPGAAVRAAGARVPADLGRRIPIASGTDLSGRKNKHRFPGVVWVGGFGGFGGQRKKKGKGGDF